MHRSLAICEGTKTKDWCAKCQADTYQSFRHDTTIFDNTPLTGLMSFCSICGTAQHIALSSVLEIKDELKPKKRRKK